MENWITQFMEQFGYFGIFLLIAIENVFPPIPSEVILTFGGFMTTHSDLTMTGVVIASTIGSVGGAIVLYGIGVLVDYKRMATFIDRWGHIFRLSQYDLARANHWFQKYGVWTVFFCRLVPLLRSLISIPAGMSHMNVGVFLLFTTLGTVIWNIFLVWIGAAVGESWDTVVGYMDVYSRVVYIVLAVLVIVLIWLWLRRKR
ncbi:DedA family protein [Bacillaceae bacterium SIJ1]|uniref:DedA family protein n=1 Tax=Litoribacterium kuwaitense TaxID=1398745 RepID=UPI0013EAC4C9|nr:DedA family protein [Litoribacterium kuwaitense]NGP45924.1 DedA family protein [Litoribacterium kuwaitense]